jgi:hypothetical protein
LAKPNYKSEKRRKDLEKLKKKEEKRQRKLERKVNPDGEAELSDAQEESSAEETVKEEKDPS